ncbi:MAG TPA: hypothetical protein VLB00_07740, partial [Gemmatimonadales bacterium]|nr:hypothetical protein [Gemmatimonadales bacterium]
APEALLYGEDAGRVVASCAPERLPEILERAAAHGVPAQEAGTVGAPGGRLEIRTRNGGTSYGWDTVSLRRAYCDAIPRRMRTEGSSGTERL